MKNWATSSCHDNKQIAFDTNYSSLDKSQNFSFIFLLLLASLQKLDIFLVLLVIFHFPCHCPGSLSGKRKTFFLLLITKIFDLSLRLGRVRWSWASFSNEQWLKTSSIWMRNKNETFHIVLMKRTTKVLIVRTISSFLATKTSPFQDELPWMTKINQSKCFSLIGKFKQTGEFHQRNVSKYRWKTHRALSTARYWFKLNKS